MMGFGVILTLLGLGAMAYMLGWRPQSNQPLTSVRSETALEILKKRYARGEITKEEFDTIRRDLQN